MAYKKGFPGFGVLLVAFLLLPSVAVRAASESKKTAEKLIKVGCVDLQAVFDSIPQKASVKNQLDQKKKDYETTQTRLERELGDLTNRERAKSEKEAERNIEIFNKQQELAQYIAKCNNDLALIEQKLVEPILDMIQEVIKDVSVSGGYSMIVDKSAAVLYVDKDIDITKEVIEKLKELHKEAELDKKHND